MAMKVLVAEDNLVNRELVRELLELRGYEVVEAYDGSDALRKVEEYDPNIVLLDIQMPVLDGFTVLRKLRNDPRFATLCIVALTAYAMRGDREKAMAAGFNGYITKPVDSVELYLGIDRVISGTSSEKQVASSEQAKNIA